MLTELKGKAGCLCEPARQGELRCPLNVRPTSEDVISGELFGTLRAINPRWWLPDLLNRALGTLRFRQQVFRELKIELWQKQSAFPPDLIPWKEGNTEVDVIITWENPATTIFIEMKYAAALSAKTTHNDGVDGFPADQLIRNARVGLHRCGWYSEDRLFEIPARDFALILLAPNRGNPLVDAYRKTERLRQAIPSADRLHRLPAAPFIGELGYGGIIEILDQKRSFLNATERRLSDQLVSYLGFKLLQHGKSPKQRWQQVGLTNL